MEFNYKDVGKEIGWDFSKMSYALEQDDPYYYYHEVVKHITRDTVMLDIGCGSGEKSVKYYALAKKVVMLDNEPEMLKKVNENLEKFYNGKMSEKFETVIGDGDEKLNFPDESFDLVVSRHCQANCILAAVRRDVSKTSESFPAATSPPHVLRCQQSG